MAPPPMEVDHFYHCLHLLVYVIQPAYCFMASKTEVIDQMKNSVRSVHSTHRVNSIMTVSLLEIEVSILKMHFLLLNRLYNPLSSLM